MATDEVTAARKAPIADTPKIVDPEHLYDRVAALQERIANRAFELFLARGSQPGSELDDWYKAEAELLHIVPVEVEAIDDLVIVRAETPGFKESELYVSIEPERVAIGGWREETTQREVAGTQQTEASSQEIFREIALPCAVETSNPKIMFDGGVVTIRLTKREPEPEPVKA